LISFGEFWALLVPQERKRIRKSASGGTGPEPPEIDGKRLERLENVATLAVTKVGGVPQWEWCNGSITKNLGPGPPRGPSSGCAAKTCSATRAGCADRMERLGKAILIRFRARMPTLMLYHRDEKHSRSRGPRAMRWRCGFVASAIWGMPTDGGTTSSSTAINNTRPPLFPRVRSKLLPRRRSTARRECICGSESERMATSFERSRGFYPEKA
jgi:hypothetical protein